MLLFLLSIASLVSYTYQAKVGCGNNPADIVFVLDSSSSIWPPHYDLMLDFVKKFASDFEVGPDKLQLGVVTYSDNVENQFNLNQHQDDMSLGKAIKAIRQKGGRTNTAAGIRYLYKKSFSKAAGMRDGVPHIGIIITDGVSNDKKDTARAAGEARQSGDLMVMSIGVGRQVNTKELQSIAGPEGNVFEVKNFEALNSIRSLISIKVCKTACGDKSPADVVFMIDSYKSGDSNTKKALNFLGELSKEFEIADDKIQVGLVHQCLVSGFPLSKYHDRESLENDVSNVHVNTFADLMKHLTLRSFTVEEGGRPDAKRIAIAILDTKFPDHGNAVRVAGKAKAQNIEIFVIGVGSGTDYKELTLVASSPADKHVFSVSSYDDLPELTQKIKIHICEDL
ncbi:unnamed protein product [Owenia fusiformis]|uniref:VWFA domain-containing protein n=1 Tax=Owenia fusiformis TaxID=6347 RepID=A0A8S4PE50_OWEFU|nr:unnamed protein product [Owenia fusiformis]